MEDYRTASKLITNNCYMGSIDLKDAYFLVPIHESQRKYLRFDFNDHLYEFNCLPFGLCTAPYVFTKVLKPVMKYLRSRGIVSVQYLDDIFLIGNSYTSCLNSINFTRLLLERLGFVINYEKSCLTPSSKSKFLGFIFNSEEMVLYLPDNKKEKVINNITHVIKLQKCKLRDFARLIGLLVSACPAIQYSWAYTKLLERHKYLYLLKNPSYEQSIHISDTVKKDLKWWLESITSGYCPFRFNEFQI